MASALLRSPPPQAQSKPDPPASAQLDPRPLGGNELREAPLSPPTPELEVWFLDDGCIGGEDTVVRAYFECLRRLSPAFGLAVNPSKCEVVAAVKSPFWHDVPKWILPQDMELLGAPCGSEVAANSFCAKVAERANRRASCIALLHNKVVANALLLFCAGFCLGNFYARVCGTQVRDHFASIDSHMMHVWQLINIWAAPKVLEQVALPRRLSGFGLNPLAPQCGLAFIAATVAAEARFGHFLTTPALDCFVQSPDSRLVLPAQDPPVAFFPPVAELAMAYLDARVPKPKGQSTLAAAHARARLDQWLVGADEVTRARVMSTSSAFASAWQSPEPGADPTWLTEQERQILVLHHLGLPLTAAPAPCVNCGGKHVADVMGLHSLACTQGPSKYRLHNGLRDGVTAYAQEALWRPRKEPRPFSADPNSRPDIIVFIGPEESRRAAVIDVAVVSHCGDSIKAAAAAAGGASTAYERKKVLRYAALAAADDYKLVPLVIDTFGAWGESALPFLKEMARAWGKRLDLHPSRSSTLMLGSLSTIHMRTIARVLLLNAGARTHATLTSAAPTTLLDD